MTSVSKVLVPTETIEQLFKAHLDIENNKRILFSAPFGAGKSFFLNNFFDKSVDRISLVIHPVDYAVSSNEDIFELIKFDILTGLIDKYFEQLDLSDDDIPEILLTQEYLRNRLEFYPIIKEILPLMIPGGEKIKTVLELIEKQTQQYQEFKDEMNQGEESSVMEYLVGHRLKKGSIREDGDYITALVKNFIKRIKEKNGDKRFVFILDDLDRLDPEHVFRLFNVFTAHHDSRTDKNKFDFEQIIFVCDVRNIHHMFQHKYGMLTDFQGYIDKFYSSHIFKFDFKAYIKQHLSKLMSAGYKFEIHFKDGAVERSLWEKYDFKNHYNNFESLLQYILSDLIDIDQIKMRSFERYNGFQLPNYQFTVLQHRSYHAHNFPFLVLIYTLQQFFPRWHELKAAFKSMSDTFAADYTHTKKTNTYDDWAIVEELIQLSLPFIIDLRAAFINKFEEGNYTYNTFNEDGFGILINYEATRYGEYRFKSGMRKKDDVPPEENDGNCARPNPYWFLLKAIEESEKNGFLRMQ